MGILGPLDVLYVECFMFCEWTLYRSFLYLAFYFPLSSLWILLHLFLSESMFLVQLYRTVDFASNPPGAGSVVEFGGGGGVGEKRGKGVKGEGEVR